MFPSSTRFSSPAPTTSFMSIVNFFYDKPILGMQDYNLILSNPILFLDKFIKEVETRVDEPDAGGMWCAILSNYYFILKQSDALTPEQKQMFSDKSQDMLNKVYEKGSCKGFLMLTFLYSAESESLRGGSDLNTLIQDYKSFIPDFLGTNTAAWIHLFGFLESKEVKSQKAMENLFKALKLNSNKTFEFLKLIPDLNSELIKILITENQIQEERIRKLENTVVELELQPSSKCDECGNEVGGGQLFKAAKDDFRSHV